MKIKNFLEENLNTCLIVLLVTICLCIGGFLCCCHTVCPNADEEAVLIKKPVIFGHGGVDPTPVSTGLTWCVFSTSEEYFKIVPVRYDVNFDDIMSNDNTPLDYATYMVLQVEQGKSPVLLQNYGKDWYKYNVEAVYRNFVREEVSKYSPFDLMSNREVCNKVDKEILQKMQVYFRQLSTKKEFPVSCKQVITGRAKLETSIMFLTRSINSLSHEPKIIKTDNTFTQIHSPLSITKRGYEKVKVLGIDFMISNNWSRIKTAIDKEVQDKNAYDINQFCIEQAVVFPEKFLTNDELLVLKNDAYKEGKSLTSYMEIIAVLCRERYFKTIGLDTSNLK